MNPTFRIVVVVICLSLVSGAVLALRPQPLDVEVASVVSAALEQKIADNGRARIRERYTVSAPVAGTLARIELHEGDVVDAGAVLARLLPLPTPLLDPAARKATEQRLASTEDGSQQAQATVTRAQIAAEQAKVELLRIEALAKQGAVSSVQLDQARVDSHMRQAELASAQFAANVATHEIGQARAALARFTPGAGKSEQFEITSPVRGKILHVLHKSEGVVAAGTALVELGDPHALELVADVLSQDAVAIKPGMPARVVHWGGEQSLTAKVRRIEPAAFTKTSALGVDEQRVNVLLDLDGSADQWRMLGDGFAVEIEITVWSKPNVVQIPTSAIFRQGSDWSAFVVENGVAKARHVEPGHRGPLQTEILSGVRPGERAIIHPGAAVRDGTRVAFR